MELRSKFKDIANAYLRAFCEKHEYEYTEEWVGQRFGEVAVLGDEFYDFNDIRYDIDNNIPVGEIEKWTRYTAHLAELECPHTINFSSWCLGAPLPYSEEMLDEIESARRRVEEARRELENLLNDDDNKF